MLEESCGLQDSLFHLASRALPVTDEGLEKHRRLYCSMIVDCTKRRSLFVTDRGCMRLGPYFMKTGDQICILRGCDYPLVVRPKGNHFVAVGGCYVYAIMQGEVLKDIENKKLHWKMLVFGWF